MSSDFAAITSITAIFVSIGSFCLGLLNRKEQQASLLLSKKTELTTRLIEANGKFGHLAMLYAQKILFLTTSDGEVVNPQEVERARNNMTIAKEKSEEMSREHIELLESESFSLAYLERRLSLVGSYLAHATAELSKEQEVFSELKGSNRTI